MRSASEIAAEGKKDVALRTAQLVQLLSEIGPDIPEISRRLGQFKESVRYRYKEKILGEGFAIQAAVDHEGLGLKRVSAVVKFAPEYEEFADSVLTYMNELCYVVGFGRTLPEGSYLVNASVPEDLVPQYKELLKSLEKERFFTRVDVYEFDAFRNVPMRAEYYDFGEGVWDYDWSSVSPILARSDVYSRSARKKFDQIDLLLLKELQADSTRSLSEVAETLKVNYKVLAWHYSKHVQERHLVKGYTVNWMGTRYESRIDRALHRKHRYVTMALLVRCANEAERMALMSKINSLPFLWAEAYGKDYYAEFAFPVDFINEAMQFLRSALSGMDERARHFVVDQTDSLSFTISYKLFDAERKQWTMNLPELQSKFAGLMLKIRQESGSQSQ
jgi:hypothetical protein